MPPSLRTGELHETPTGILAGLVEEVVRIEGPVHSGEVTDRIRTAWGLKRAGNRIQGAVEAAIAVAVADGRIERTLAFLSVPGAAVTVRDRSAAPSPTLRRADRLPPAEVALAALDVIRTNFGANREQVVQAVSRAVGNKATSSSVRELIKGEIDGLLRVGTLSEQTGILTLVD